MPRSKLILAGLAGFAVSTAPAMAVPRYLTPDPLPTSQQIGVPFYSRDVGIPGPNRICIKQCRRDSSPCDPPEYKKADGRCYFFF